MKTNEPAADDAKGWELEARRAQVIVYEQRVELEQLRDALRWLLLNIDGMRLPKGTSSAELLQRLEVAGRVMRWGTSL